METDIAKNPNIIRDECPLSFAKLKTWYSSLLNIKDEKGLSDEGLLLIISVNTRKLYDFFDEAGIFVRIDYIKEKGFASNVIGYDWSHYFKSRIEAEFEGFIEAFKIMEKGQFKS